jgi:hypothetical protein
MQTAPAAGHPCLRRLRDGGQAYERGRCDNCSLRRRAATLLAGPADGIPAEFRPVFEALDADPRRRAVASFLTWLTAATAP